jgi:ATP-dependent RNA helicase DHX36
MYAIACILSYDGLPDMCPSNDLLQNSVEARRFSLGKKGYIPPGGYLRSFLVDRAHHAPYSQNSSNHPGGASAYTQPSRAPVGRFDQSQRSFRNSGPGSSKPRSFKRQRNTAL